MMNEDHLFQNKKIECIPTSVVPPNSVLNKINIESFIILSQREIGIKLECLDEQFFTIQGEKLHWPISNPQL